MNHEENDSVHQSEEEEEQNDQNDENVHEGSGNEQHQQAENQIQEEEI